jgi:hypothetical protein
MGGQRSKYVNTVDKLPASANCNSAYTLFRNPRACLINLIFTRISLHVQEYTLNADFARRRYKT